MMSADSRHPPVRPEPFDCAVHSPFVLSRLSPAGKAKQRNCHREERSDVAIHLEFSVDCRSHQGSFAMTTTVCSLEGAASRGDEAIQLDRHGALRAPRDDKQV